MSTVHVVEIRELTDEVVEVPIARYVLTPAGEARFIELRSHAQSLVEMLFHRGVPGPDGDVAVSPGRARLHAASALSPGWVPHVGHGRL